MIRWLVVVVFGANLFAVAAGASVLCVKKSGAIALREACRKKETQLDPSQAGIVGPKGDKGDQGNTGAMGVPGQDLTSTTTLASGETLTGAFIATAGSSTSGYASASFQFHPRLPADLDGGHVVFQAPSTTSSNCPGIDHAAAGYLCVYANQFSGMTFNSFNNTEGTQGTNRTGGLLFFDVAGASAYVTGRWAVTAP